MLDVLVSRLLERLALLRLRLRDGGRSRCSGTACTGGRGVTLRAASDSASSFFLSDDFRFRRPPRSGAEAALVSLDRGLSRERERRPELRRFGMGSITTLLSSVGCGATR